jgi:hypothetical protein
MLQEKRSEQKGPQGSRDWSESTIQSPVCKPISFEQSKLLESDSFDLVQKNQSDSSGNQL